MRRWIWVIVVAVAASIVASLFAGEKEKCTAPADECVAKLHAKLSQVGWLGIETEKVDGKNKQITAVVQGSPAETAGFMVGDILLAAGDVKLGDAATEKQVQMKQEQMKHDQTKQVKVMKKRQGPGDEVTYVVKRGDSKVKLTARLGTMPMDVMAQHVGEHMLSSHLGVKVASH